MRPIPWNKAFRKKDGSLVNMEDIGGGGGSNLPPHSSTDAGKVLEVNNEGNLAWDTVDPFSRYGVYGPYVAPAPIFKPSSTSGKYNIGIWSGSITSTSNRTFQSGDYDLSQCFIGDVANYHEFYNYLTSSVISGLDMELLCDSKDTAVSTAELLDAITDYDFLVLQGCYDTSGSSQYDTTMIYSGIDLNRSYWFGVKDRNTQYSGSLTFADATHVNLSSSRRIMIYGIKSE